VGIWPYSVGGARDADLVVTGIHSALGKKEAGHDLHLVKKKDDRVPARPGWLDGFALVAEDYSKARPIAFGPCPIPEGV